MIVTYVGGYWSTNIGNGFFNIGADYVLKNVFGQDNVKITFDQPAGITPKSGRKRNESNALEFIKHVETDYIVLLGPVISRDFLEIWKETIIHLSKKGIKYMLLSCGMMKITQKDIDECKAFFLEYPPYVLCTRDRKTYDVFHDFASYSYDGICFAFFTPDAYIPLKLDFEKILALNFDKVFEPKIQISDIKKNKKSFEFENRFWNLRFNRFVSKIGGKTDRFSDSLVYLLSVFPTRKRACTLDEYTMIRTDHRFSPMMKRKVYRYSNSFASDLPYPYLDIYAQAHLTLSDRVHACAISLAYGNSAMLFSKTKRSALLDRVGAFEIDKQPVKIDLSLLSKEKANLLDWMKSIRY